MQVATKRIRERVHQMNNAWKQGAPTAVFNGITQPDFQTRIDATDAADQEIADMEAQLAIKKDARENLYDSLNADSVKVRDGVEGHKDFGDDHPLLTAMGFKTKSDRKSGLTRKKVKSPPPA